MLGLDSVASVAHVIQVALTPVSCFPESRLSLLSFRRASPEWPMASTRLLSSWKRPDQ
jgi:hypothetical protein